MHRGELGMRLQQWHSSQSDPVYAVGSYYAAGYPYPEKNTVKDAVANLLDDLDKFQKMLDGIVISQYNHHYDRMVTDLRKFAGYTDAELKENIQELEEIVRALNRFLAKDYKRGIINDAS